MVQDPNQLTKHGKSKVAPVIYTLDQSEDEHGSSVSTPSDLQITTAREAEDGQGFFQTLAPLSKRKPGASRKAAAHQKRKLELYLQHLQAELAIRAIKPASSETTLIARYINMLGSKSAAKQPLSILGTWIQSIPSRIGSNAMMDLAVEFFVNSYDVYWNDTYSKRSLARASKEKALKELQLFVLNIQNKPTYEVILATKMHYAAEVCWVSSRVARYNTNTDRRCWASIQCIMLSTRLGWRNCSRVVHPLRMWTTSIFGT